MMAMVCVVVDPHTPNSHLGIGRGGTRKKLKFLVDGLGAVGFSCAL